MRSFFRIALLVLILIAVGVISALTAMRIAIHGREVVIPNLQGKTVAEAEKIAVANELAFLVEGSFYSGQVPEGRILSQVPTPGTKVRRGWRLRAAQSLGPQRSVIPDVVGQSSRAAELNLRQRGLELGTIANASLPDSVSGQVVAQSPSANAQVNSPKVSLLIATDPPATSLLMPNFVGTNLSDARTAITNAGLKLEVTTTAAPSPNPPLIASTPGSVIHQIPAPGQKVAPGMTVNLEVAH